MVFQEAKPFLLALILLSIAGFWLHPALGILGIVLLLYVLWFFRDPRRTPPPEAEALVSAADGRVIAVDEVDAPFELGRMRRVAVFLSVFDVHVNRCPWQGRIKALHHHAGEFLDARDPRVEQQNEAMNWHLDTPRGPLVLRQIAGLIARRIVAWKTPGQELRRGERIGMIRFGSRTDVYLPLTCRICVAPGDSVRGGQTVIALWP